jgi:hypothetical protein
VWLPLIRANISSASISSIEDSSDVSSETVRWWEVVWTMGFGLSCVIFEFESKDLRKKICLRPSVRPPPVFLTLKRTDPVAFAYILQFLKTGCLSLKNKFGPTLLMEILQEAEFLHMDPPLKS